MKEMSAPVTSISVSRVISALCSLMGKPNSIISDNGTRYTGKPFQDLCHWWGINHITSSPYYPRSNGFAERMVGTVKHILQKCLINNQNIDIALLHLRATPISSKLPSPAEMMFGRPVSTTLPSRHEVTLETQTQRKHLQEDRLS